MRIVFNEVELVNEALENGIISDKPTHTIKALAKHYFKVGKSKKEVKNEIINFMTLNVPNFNPIDWEINLKKWIESVSKIKDKKLSGVKDVRITKSELAEIVSLNDLNTERLAFVLLVQCKISNTISGKNDNWVNSGVKDLFKDADIVLNVMNLKLHAHELKKRGMIATSRVVNSEGINVKYVNENSEVAMIITDFKNYINEYVRWKELAKIFNCEKCGIATEAVTNNQKYCTGCKRLVKNEKQKIADRKNKA